MPEQSSIDTGHLSDTANSSRQYRGAIRAHGDNCEKSLLISI
jgi:hypothetical protein